MVEPTYEPANGSSSHDDTRRLDDLIADINRRADRSDRVVLAIQFVVTLAAFVLTVACASGLL